MTGTSTEKLRNTLIARTPATQRVIIWTSLCEVDDAELFFGSAYSIFSTSLVIVIYIAHVKPSCFRQTGISR